MNGLLGRGPEKKPRLPRRGLLAPPDEAGWAMRPSTGPSMEGRVLQGLLGALPGMIPGIGEGMDVRDFIQSAKAGSGLGMGLSALSAALPFVGGLGGAYRSLKHADIASLPLDEVARSARFELSRDKNILKELFGEEGAKRYNRLQTRANSMTATHEATNAAYREVEAMENALTEAQRNRLFGIGETGLALDDWKDIDRALQGRFDAPDMNATELRNIVGREILTGRPARNADSLIRLRIAWEELVRRGVSTDEIAKSVAERAGREGLSVGDAKDLAEMAFRELREAGMRFGGGISPNMGLLGR